jgi:DNA-binding response OmpR family regulator
MRAYRAGARGSAGGHSRWTRAGRYPNRGPKLDLARRLLWRGDDEIHLSPKEFDLLAFMMKNSDAILPHVKLLRSVWGLEYGGELEYLRTYVRTLRKKIEKIPANPEYIVSVPWIGYRFRKPKDSRGAESQMTDDSTASDRTVHPPEWALVSRLRRSSIF